MPGPTDESSTARWRWLWACGGVIAACAAEPEGDALHADGAACEWSAECRSGLCVPERSGAGETGWTGGMCVSVCGGGGACGDGGVCVRFDAEALCVPACDSPAGCREGYVCADGACVPDCRQGFACGAQRVCDLEDGRCRLPVSPGASFGQGCAEDGECASFVCLEAVDEAGQATGWVGGLCSASCAGEAACPEGGVCIRLGEHLLCVLACETAGGCEAGYVCHPEAGACLPDCRLGWSCGDALVCDPVDGVCRLPETPAAGFGEACAEDGACASLVCLEAVDEAGQATGWVGGLCSASCAGEAACPEGGVCIRLGEHLLCVLACEAVGGCQAGYVCHPEAGACLPDCRLGWECAAGFACDEGSGACVIEVVVPAEVGAPCEVAADCASGICVPSEDVDGATGWTDGMCIAPCGSVLCGEATGCAILDGASWCLPACSSGCRAGYVCDPDYGACLPDCRLGWPCIGTFTCSLETGVCRAPTGGELWSACADDLACESGVCVPEAGSAGLVEGRCSAPCTTSCPLGFVCVDLGAERACTPLCGGQDACPATWVCEPRVDACVPSCQAGWPCSGDEQCNASGLCRSGGPGGR